MYDSVVVNSRPAVIIQSNGYSIIHINHLIVVYVDIFRMFQIDCLLQIAKRISRYDGILCVKQVNSDFVD